MRGRISGVYISGVRDNGPKNRLLTSLYTIKALADLPVQVVFIARVNCPETAGALIFS